MAQPRFFSFSVREFSPAAVGTEERTVLWAVNPGDALLWLRLMLLTAADSGSDCELSIGTDDEPEAFWRRTTLNLEGESTVDSPEVVRTVTKRPYGGSGTLLDNPGGYVFDRPTAVYVYYWVPTSGGSTAPKVRIWGAGVREDGFLATRNF